MIKIMSKVILSFIFKYYLININIEFKSSVNKC
jgi:hypothetical protein